MSVAEASWQPCGRLVASTPWDKVPSGLISDGKGGMIVVWTAQTGDTLQQTEVRAQRLDPSGVPLWTSDPAGSPLCVAGGTQSFPHVIADGAGGAFLSWSDQRSWGQIYALRIGGDGNDVGGWPEEGLRIAPTGGTQFEDDIASDGSGGVYIVWSDGRNSSSVGADIYVQRLTGDGKAANGWPSGGVPICSAPANQEQPTLVADGTGGVIVCWRDHRNEPTDYFLGYGDIYAQHVLPDGRIATGWPVDGLPVCLAPFGQDLPVIVEDGVGGAIIVWRDFRTYTGSNVYAERVSRAGLLLWGNGSGVAVGAVPGFQWYPNAVTDGSHGAYVGWEGGNPGSPSGVYLAHVGEGGKPFFGWAQGGRYMEGSGLVNPESAVLTSDGAGGVWVAWTQAPAALTQNYTIYLSRYSATGTAPRSWRSNPLGVCSDLGWRFISGPISASHGGTILGDGNGGVYVAWADRREGDHFDVFAQRVGATGRIVPDPQSPPRILSARPNPAQTETHLTVLMPSTGSARLEMYDVSGRLRAAHVISGLAGSSTEVSVSLVGLPSGLYLVRMVDANGVLLSSRKVLHLR